MAAPPFQQQLKPGPAFNTGGPGPKQQFTPQQRQQVPYGGASQMSMPFQPQAQMGGPYAKQPYNVMPMPV